MTDNEPVVGVISELRCRGCGRILASTQVDTGPGGDSDEDPFPGFGGGCFTCGATDAVLKSYTLLET